MVLLLRYINYTHNFLVNARRQPSTTVKPDAGEYVDVYEASAGWNTSDDYWDEFEDTINEKDVDECSVASGQVFSIPLTAIVLYDYVATSTDELTITENEEVEVLEKDGEGWCKVNVLYEEFLDF